jgi:ADP-heptose:LPS heptosyltransferase
LAGHGECILVIKLGALGDFILALAAFQAIRRAHPQAEITLLTTVPFQALVEAAPWFDRVWIDGKPKGLAGLWQLRNRLRAAKFTRIYDLQTSSRSNLYYKLLWPHRPDWNGNAPGCSHPDPTPVRSAVHAFQLRVNQLRAAGITEVPPADLSWLAGDIGRFFLPEAYVLLVPGAAPHRPAKRWPAVHYAELAGLLAQRGLTPVVLGTAEEAAAARTIIAAVPNAIDLTGKTTLFDLASLARGAKAAVGNDTGPMHLIAAAGCPALVLFCTKEADPAHSGPVGTQVEIIAREDLSRLAVADVQAALLAFPALM